MTDTRKSLFDKNEIHDCKSKTFIRYGPTVFYMHEDVKTDFIFMENNIATIIILRMTDILRVATLFPYVFIRFYQSLKLHMTYRTKYINLCTRSPF